MFVLNALHSIAARLGDRKPNKSPLQPELLTRVICSLSLRGLQMTLGSLLSPKRDPSCQDAKRSATPKRTNIITIHIKKDVKYSVGL